ncbi:helix-turn-helix domain-containing protein [Enterococcus asini]|uniref:helix-turn-helix domain-containing protein n=1 Tax=Enterococcus asini TaxID=57732 RepID=UPI000E529256|nr:helix-turn-helix transcriptional regulator [Enterococcus asini]RGW15224.1 XRE family transcriptional regulator [Enterococcus asini]
MLQITLGAARVNSDLKQSDVVDILKEKYGVTITRQRLAEYERDASDVPIALAKKLADIYGLTQENIFFGDKSTLSYTFRLKNKKEVG